MIISISTNAAELGKSAAILTAEKLMASIESNGSARLVLSTGASQFETLSELLNTSVPWELVEIFHLDEYIGLPVTHPASFRKYLIERFISRINCKAFYPVDTDRDIPELLEYLSGKIACSDPDVGLIGIGVNSHIAFNDPPADYNTTDPYIIVKLDRKCRMQQVNEGWFGSLDEVPPTAVSMSVNQILKCKTIISAVPHEVKADAICRTLTSGTDPMVPSSVLKNHADYNLFIDRFSASGIFRF